MVHSIKEGAKEEELDGIEAQVGCKLSNDCRCSYRIHNGQKLVVPGLMGSMALSNHYRSEDLLDIETAAVGFKQRKGLSQYMALRAAARSSTTDQMAQDPSAIYMFITGSSFTEWFTSYVHNGVTGEYPIIRDQIFRYVHDKQLSTSFLPELSLVHPPHFFFTYRIRIEMANDAIPENACRYWKITNANGNLEEVRVVRRSVIPLRKETCSVS
uniref:F-box protein 3 n=1 Tax=Salmo trutta TaxID=8032 RepID=A0A673XXV1_SALTR